MKKLTVKELAELGITIGDKILIEAEIIAADVDSVTPIKIKLPQNNELKLLSSTEICLPEAPEPEARKVRVGDVYEWIREDPEKGMQWIQKEDLQECIKGVGVYYDTETFENWDFSIKSYWKFLYNVNDNQQETTPQVPKIGDVYSLPLVQIKILSLHAEKKLTFWGEVIESKDPAYPIGAKCNWHLSDEWKFIYNVNDQKQEPEQKPEPETLVVGEYWHHPKYNTEIIILPNLGFEFTKAGTWADIFGDPGKHTEIGKSFVETDYNSLTLRGYIRGRHPENVAQPEPDLYPDGMEWKTIAECKPCVGDVLEWKIDNKPIEDWKAKTVNDEAVYFEHGTRIYLTAFAKCFRVKSRAQPEQWQPKEGELVWVKFLEKSFEIVSIPENGKVWVFNESYMTHHFPIPLSELEPYANQDAPKIDFSVAGQLLFKPNFGYVITVIDTDEESANSAYIEGKYFDAICLPGWNISSFENDGSWQLCTPEQIKLIEQLQQSLQIEK